MQLVIMDYFAVSILMLYVREYYEISFAAIYLLRKLFIKVTFYSQKFSSFHSFTSHPDQGMNFVEGGPQQEFISTGNFIMTCSLFVRSFITKNRTLRLNI